MLSIACLSQKGGVGKSTLARLMATYYAHGKWRTKIADFNVKQKTSVDWAAMRMAQKLNPEVQAEAFTDVAKACSPSNRGQLDLMVFDGKPDADTQTITLAREADLILVPTSISADDLVPQIRFGQELQMRGIPRNKIVFVLTNSTSESPAAVVDARNYITSAGFEVLKTDLPRKIGYLNAQNTGRTLTETGFLSLNVRANTLAKEVVDRLTKLTEEEGRAA